MTLEAQAMALLNAHSPYWWIIAGIVVVFVIVATGWQGKEK